MAIVSSAKAGMHAAPRATVLQLRTPGLNARELEREAVRLVSSSPLPVLMAEAIRIGVEAGRKSFLAGRIPRLPHAAASSPTTGVSPRS